MTTINKQVSLGTDDCSESTDTTIYLTSEATYVGWSGGAWDTGLRWQSVNIPQAATITSAKLSLYLTSQSGSSMEANIRGIDEDNTATWSSGSRPSQRGKTTATINANQANWNNWGTTNWVDIDITSVIKEIVDRGGWSANNALAVVVEDTAGGGDPFKAFASYEYAGNAHGAKLDIVYEVRTAKLSRSTMNVHPGVMFQTLTGGHGY